MSRRHVCTQVFAVFAIETRDHPLRITLLVIRAWPLVDKILYFFKTSVLRPTLFLFVSHVMDQRLTKVVFDLGTCLCLASVIEF